MKQWRIVQTWELSGLDGIPYQTEQRARHYPGNWSRSEALLAAYDAWEDASDMLPSEHERARRSYRATAHRITGRGIA